MIRRGIVLLLLFSNLHAALFDPIKKGVKKGTQAVTQRGKEGFQATLKGVTTTPAAVKRSFAPQKLGKWVLPNSSLRYDQVSYLTAHNAFSSTEEGFAVTYQQIWSLEKQLARGVRGFMDDPHWQDGQLLLCHKGCAKDKRFGTKGPAGKYRTFKSSLKLRWNWLIRNPQEVVTLILDGTTSNENIRRDIDSIPGLRKIILTKQDWDPDAHNGMWPTLNWMQQKNKRLVIFVSFPVERDDAPFFYTWRYVAENQFAAVGKAACAQRLQSTEAGQKYPNRRMSIFNHFGKSGDGQFAAKTIEYNSYETLKRVTRSCSLPLFKTPNFVALDYVNDSHDGSMRFINELNRFDFARTRP